MVARTRLNIGLYINCFSCFNVHRRRRRRHRHHHHHHNHHHHHLTNMELSHWLTRSSTTRLVVSLNVSPGLKVKVINLPKIIATI
jgi:hypothetical protein